jgi:hypothetical protein
MPTLLLPCGQAISLDEEDYDWALSQTWYVRDRPDRPRTIIRDEMIGGRVFRIFLHREIALRINPALEEKLQLLKVKAINGDFTDVRRCNLSILIGKRRGKVPTIKKPVGTRKYVPKKRRRGTILETELPKRGSKLWANGITHDRKRTAGQIRRNEFIFAGRLVVKPDGQRGD